MTFMNDIIPGAGTMNLRSSELSESTMPVTDLREIDAESGMLVIHSVIKVILPANPVAIDIVNWKPLSDSEKKSVTKPEIVKK